MHNGLKWQAYVPLIHIAYDDGNFNNKGIILPVVASFSLSGFELPNIDIVYFLTIAFWKCYLLCLVGFWPYLRKDYDSLMLVLAML